MYILKYYPVYPIMNILKDVADLTNVFELAISLIAYALRNLLECSLLIYNNIQ